MKARGALVDFYEGSHGGSPADAYARSGMREHAAQSLCAIATVLGQRATTTALGAVTKECVGGTLVEKLSELVATESNRFTYGWAAEALRRLAPVHPAASVAFEAFLRGPRWKPPQMQLELLEPVPPAPSLAVLHRWTLPRRWRLQKQKLAIESSQIKNLLT